MAIRTIIRDTDDFLRKKSREVTVFDKRLHTLLDDMADTMHAANGVGLAAVQVGTLRRAVVIDVGDEDGVIELINPVIIETSEEEQTDAEGCLSFPGQYGMVTRPMHVKAQAQNRHGDLIEVEGSGLKARALCHETDHLDGMLFVDLVEEVLERDDEDDE